MSEAPKKPAKEVRDKQDPEHSEQDFLHDLEKGTSNRARKALERLSERDQGSPKKAE